MFDDILTQGFGLDFFGEFLGDLEAYVGIQQGPPDFLHGFRNIVFGNSALAFEGPHRLFKAIA
jgi:hypothetical protein